MYYPITCRAIYNDVRRRMADGRCVRQSTTIQPRTAGLATTYDQADMSSKSASIRLQPSIINEVRTRNKLEANTAIHVVKSIKRDLEQWTVTEQECEEQQAYEKVPQKAFNSTFLKRNRKEYIEKYTFPEDFFRNEKRLHSAVIPLQTKS